jgi:hypothetical protein
MYYKTRSSTKYRRPEILNTSNIIVETEDYWKKQNTKSDAEIQTIRQKKSWTLEGKLIK